jgi:hypothetical protein
MTHTARLLTLLAVFFFSAGCSHLAPLTPTPLPPKSGDPLPADALRASPNRLVGRIFSVDATLGFAFVDLTSEPPGAALADGAELTARHDDLSETARLQTTRLLRGRTLAVKIIAGRPAPGNEVVIRSP